VVVGVDGSGGGERTLLLAAESARRLGVGLIALTAADQGRVGPGDGSQHGLIAAQLALCRARHPGLSIESRLVEDDPAEALLHAAGQAQMVVVGSRGHGATAGGLLGSTSRALLRAGPCAVAVLSPHTPLPPTRLSPVPPAAEITLDAEAGHDRGTRPAGVSS
jgi:nucleotide-binding universal stress UspA family protein